jgi:hypothetical protein
MWRRLLTMLAHIQGGMLNALQPGNSLDVTYHTVQRYLSVLEQTFIIRRLPLCPAFLKDAARREYFRIGRKLERLLKQVFVVEVAIGIGVGFFLPVPVLMIQVIGQPRHRLGRIE